MSWLIVIEEVRAHHRHDLALIGLTAVIGRIGQINCQPPSLAPGVGANGALHAQRRIANDARQPEPAEWTTGAASGTKGALLPGGP